MKEEKKLDRTRPVAIWIMIGVGMLLIQVILGGITRLTGSGLSITEWDVITGTLPPMNDAQWDKEFARYKETAQYNILNTEFTLRDFKFIFFWEWIHRFWARLIAVAFLIPFVIFLLQKRINREMVAPLVLLFLLGALQGAIGWIMVLSGLTGDAVYVKPTKLALHFVLALVLIAYSFWVGLKWMAPKVGLAHRPTRSLTILIMLITFLQFIFGALMAGHRAALVAPTWPSINGSIIPPGMGRFKPKLINLVENTITIHFIHRGLAYLLLILVVLWTVSASRIPKGDSLIRKNRYLPLIMICLQLVLGILAILNSPTIVPNQWARFEWLALLHQGIGMLFLLSMVGMLYLLTPKYQTQHL